MQENYNVTGMTCAACQARVQKSVSHQYFYAERSVQSSLRFAHCHLYEGVSGYTKP